jgi:hypothetical protein
VQKRQDRLTGKETFVSLTCPRVRPAIGALGSEMISTGASHSRVEVEHVEGLVFSAQSTPSRLHEESFGWLCWPQ